jgi:hypothetical protein
MSTAKEIALAGIRQLRDGKLRNIPERRWKRMWRPVFDALYAAADVAQHLAAARRRGSSKP